MKLVVQLPWDGAGGGSAGECALVDDQVDGAAGPRQRVVSIGDRVEAWGLRAGEWRCCPSAELHRDWQEAWSWLGLAGRLSPPGGDKVADSVTASAAGCIAG